MHFQTTDILGITITITVVLIIVNSFIRDRKNIETVKQGIQAGLSNTANDARTLYNSSLDKNNIIFQEFTD
jgi:hypothetical protein